ncbi:hypothetical protein A4A49_10920 [Nicotiana attenuata]|uniref:Uncharacterized protein n=1 Tax=Nicotiana attenuata TaxID=49451 RepID=A0A314KRK9_NICAT|nr:hypothetical protein A4A49_10920 [Nicotiana attenuata]
MAIKSRSVFVLVLLISFIALTFFAEISEAKYIGYGPIREGDKTPCSRKGSSGKNCHLGKPAQPYSRGCEAINRCRQDPPPAEAVLIADPPHAKDVLLD